MSISKYFYFIILFSTILVFAFADAVNSVLMFHNDGTGYPKFSIYFRGLFEIFILSWLFFYYRKISVKDSQILILCCFLLIGSIFSYWVLLLTSVDGNFSVFFSLINKTMFFFISFLFVHKSFEKMNLTQTKYIFNAYELIIYINSFCAILGLIFNISIFKTYGTNRFGYIGFIPAQNEASLFWLIALFYSLFVYKEEYRKLPLLFSVIGSLLLGTKAGWVCVLVSIPWFFYKFYPKTGKKIIILLMSVMVLIVFVYIEKISEYLKSLEMFSYFVWRLDKMDAASIFLSGRDEFIYRFTHTLSLWSFPNYLFGGILTEGNNHITTEMDILDIIMIFGFVGSIIFLMIYKQIFSQIHKSYKIIFSVLFFSMAFIGGHVLWSALNALYLCLFVCKTMKLNNTNI